LAGKYSRAASGNFGSTTLSQRVMERVSTSQSEVMYCRTGPKPGLVCAEATPGAYVKTTRKFTRTTEVQVNRDRGFRSIESPKFDRHATYPCAARDMAFAGLGAGYRNQFRTGLDLRKKALRLCYLARIPLPPALFKLPLLGRFDGTRP